MWLSLVAVAAAHPLDATTWGIAIEVGLREDVAVIDYRAEIPAAEVMRDLFEARRAGRAEGFGAARIAGLREGLEIVLDGAPAAGTDVAVPQHADDPRFVPYRLRVEVPLGPGDHTLELRDHNGAGAVRAAAAEVDGAWTVTEAARFDGGWRADRTPPTVSFRPAGPVERWLRPRPTPVADALALPLVDGWTAGQARAGAAMGVAALAALSIAATPRASWATAWVALGLVAPWGPTWAVTAVGTIAGAVAAGRGDPGAWAVLVAAAAGVAGPRAAVLVVAAAAVAAITRRFLPVDPRLGHVGVAAALGVVTALAARGGLAGWALPS